MRITLTVFLFLICAPINALSDDLLSCVDPDVVTTLLSFGYRSGSEITDEMPNELSIVRYPDTFNFIGSLKSEHLISAAFRTNLDPDGAESVLAGLYGEQGWRPMPRARESMRSGFRPSRETARRQMNLCHADGNRVSIMARELERGTFVTVFSTDTARSSDCNQEPTADGSIRWGFTDDLMPDLALPANSSSRGSGGGGIIQSSGDDADTHVRVITELQPEELLEHFSSQLAAQGWLADSSWVGESSQGNTWSLSREGLPRTVGNLHLVTHSIGDYTVKFSMIAM
jgi:hypothetical protein